MYTNWYSGMFMNVDIFMGIDQNIDGSYFKVVRFTVTLL